VKEEIQKFNGDIEHAPKFLLQLCMKVQQYNFSVPQVVNIMLSRFTGEAHAWFLGIAPGAITLPDPQAIPYVIEKFREQYMSDTHRENLRELVRSTVMRETSVTRKALKDHYRVFMERMNNLSIMDPSLTIETKLTMFRQSLHPQLLMFIGDSYKTCNNIDKLFQLADSAVDTVNKLNRKKGEETIPFNALTAIRDRRGKSVSPSRRQGDPPAMQCFHCGRKGHGVLECRDLAERKPQSTAGATVFLQWCKLTGVNYEYNPQKFLNKRKGSNPNNNNNNNHDNTPSPSPLGKEDKKSRGRQRDNSPHPKKDKRQNRDKSPPPNTPKPIAVSDDDDDEEDEELKNTPTRS
jgi:hypothetical protein